MASFLIKTLLLGSATAAATHSSFRSRSIRARTNETWMGIQSTKPAYPFAADTISSCTFWYDHSDSDFTCSLMPEFWGISAAEWHYWNPSIGADCSNFPLQMSYCVDSPDEPPPSASSSSALPTPTSTATPPPSTTTPGVIETPEPTQPGMVNNCDEFYFVVSGDTCASIASAHGITEERFAEWNTGVGGTACTGLWQKVYVCVSIVGHTPTPTDPGNGIETPMPTQPGMVDNCDEFYMVVSGDTCTAIASKHGITEEQFRTWNTGVGSDCSGIWLNTYTCVSIIGHTPTPTDPGNGIETPMPTQPGMVDNCDEFYMVVSGDTCDSITSRKGISKDQLTTWNTGIGSDCKGLWLNTYACISIVGHTPTPTDPGNGIQTPLPIQSGMVDNCNKFHFVATNQNCDNIAAIYGISVSDFYRWNPAVGSSCSSLWSSTYACVGVKA